MATLGVEQGDEGGVLEGLRGVQRGDIALVQVPQEGVEVGDGEAELQEVVAPVRVRGPRSAAGWIVK